MNKVDFKLQGDTRSIWYISPCGRYIPLVDKFRQVGKKCVIGNIDFPEVQKYFLGIGRFTNNH